MVLFVVVWFPQNLADCQTTNIQPEVRQELVLGTFLANYYIVPPRWMSIQLSLYLVVSYHGTKR